MARGKSGGEDSDNKKKKVVDLEKHRKDKGLPPAKHRPVEPKELFDDLGDEFNEIEVGPEDGHWYGPGTTKE